MLVLYMVCLIKYPNNPTGGEGYYDTCCAVRKIGGMHGVHTGVQDSIPALPVAPLPDFMP